MVSWSSPAFIAAEIQKLQRLVQTSDEVMVDKAVCACLVVSQSLGISEGCIALRAHQILARVVDLKVSCVDIRRCLPF
jgi:hypothetical protein